MIAFSKRSEPGGEPTAFSLAVSQARDTGRIRWDLSVSNPTSVGLPLPDLSSVLGQASKADYQPESLGLMSARASAAQVLRARGIPATPERMLLTASTSEAYSLLFKLLADPGDGVLVPTPSYPLLTHLVRAEGLNAVTYPLEYDGAWHVDLAGLRSAVRRASRPRALVVVSPNNPTGSYLLAEEARLMEELGLPLIVDEVFAEYPVDASCGVGGTQQARQAAHLLSSCQALHFSLGGLSKFALSPHLKLAWTSVGGPASLLEGAMHRLSHLADNYLSVAAPVQVALPEILEATSLARRALADRIRTNLESLRREIPPTPVTVLEVAGGWHAILRLPHYVDEERLVLALLREGVLVQPGWFYDFQAQSHVVLSLIVEPDIFVPGVRKMLSVTADFDR